MGLRNKVIANVSIGESPSDLIVDPNEPWIYVANFGPNTVSVIHVDIQSGGEY